MHLHNCMRFQEHLRMLLQSVRKKRRNFNRRAMCNATRSIDAWRGVIWHLGVSGGTDGARALWRSHSARTEMSFADGEPPFLFWCLWVQSTTYIWWKRFSFCWCGILLDHSFPSQSGGGGGGGIKIYVFNNKLSSWHYLAISITPWHLSR